MEAEDEAVLTLRLANERPHIDSTDHSVSSSQTRRLGERLKDGDEPVVQVVENGEQTDVEKQDSDPSQPSDFNIVDWNGRDDPNNPMNWTSNRKWSIIGLISAVTFNTSVYLISLRHCK